MLIQVPEILTSDRAEAMRQQLEGAGWVDGKVTAGRQSAEVKTNRQIAANDPLHQELGAEIVRALEQSALFMSSALPQKVFPPLFNRYDAGDRFGFHVDNAIRQVPQTLERVRTDLSATLFLTRPEDYEGGELVIEDTYGVHSIKLPAGHLILYPASSLHEVRPVTRGTRIASFFWIQSMVRDDGKRTLLFDLDVAIQRISNEIQNQAARVQLTSIYHNLLRRWAEL